MNGSIVRVMSALFLLIGMSHTVKAQTDEPLKFLFIGNSFTYYNDMPNMFDKMAKKEGRSVIVESNTKGGASFKVHTTRKDMFEAIRKRQWDYVVLQGFSRELSFPKEYMDTATFPYVQQILDSVHANNICTDVLFYMTWGYENGYPARPEVKSYTQMADSIASGYQLMGDLYDVPVVPVGMVWKEMRAQSNANLYHTDGFHPGTNGSYLAASTFYSSIFNAKNELFRPMGVDKKTGELINELAFDYVVENRALYELDRGYYEVKTEKGNKISFESLFSEDANSTWVFDHKDTIISASGVYKFKKRGNHKVHLKVQDDCGKIRNYDFNIRTGKRPILRPSRRREKDSTNEE